MNTTSEQGSECTLHLSAHQERRKHTEESEEANLVNLVIVAQQLSCCGLCKCWVVQGL